MFRRRKAPEPASAPAPVPSLDSTVSEADRAILERTRPYTMTGDARILALIDAVRYVVARGVPGDFAECGVWRGGSAYFGSDNSSRCHERRSEY